MSSPKNRNLEKDLCKNEQEVQNSTDDQKQIEEETPNISAIIKGCFGMLTPTIGFIFSLYYTHD